MTMKIEEFKMHLFEMLAAPLSPIAFPHHEVE